jgi:hypothetical protein
MRKVAAATEDAAEVGARRQKVERLGGAAGDRTALIENCDQTGGK